MSEGGTLAGVRLLLVGGGRMGEALLAGWLAQGLAPGTTLVVEPDPARRAELGRAHGVATFAGPEALPAAAVPDVLLLAVKPQVMATALPAYRERIAPRTLLLSIAAAIPIASFEAALGAAQPIVRAMPNTPAAVGRGTTVLCPNRAADADARSLAGRLMAAVGEVHWVAVEDLLHAVTAVSGSGPAYLFLLIEAMAEAGAKAGLPPDLAMRLARATVTGAAELAFLEQEQPAAELRRNVTSPRGTTEAALRVLMADEAGLGSLMTRAVAAAAARSRELAG